MAAGGFSSNAERAQCQTEVASWRSFAAHRKRRPWVRCYGVIKSRAVNEVEKNWSCKWFALVRPARRLGRHGRRQIDGVCFMIHLAASVPRPQGGWVIIRGGSMTMGMPRPVLMGMFMPVRGTADGRDMDVRLGGVLFVPQSAAMRVRDRS